MPEPVPLRDRYLELIDQIVTITLQGKIRSKEQVYQMLVQQVSAGTGEIFERCLEQRVQEVQAQIASLQDELKLAKANRVLRATQTIVGEYGRWQQENQVSAAIASIVNQITQAEESDRLSILLSAIDANQTPALTLEQIQQLAKTLQTLAPEVQLLGQGLAQGLGAWQRLSPHLVSWIYDQSRPQLGFAGAPGQRGPWVLWAKEVKSYFPEAVFQTIAQNQSLSATVANQTGINFAAMVELAVILQCLQRGLVEWFDKLIYDAKVGAKLSISTFLTFAAIWSQLANGFNGREKQIYADACFQITLQILRAFSQQEYFPMYGGIFASFAGDYLREALNYLDTPLRRVEGTQAKARILTLLGYSLRVQGRYEQAHEWHQQALEIARTAGDRPCEIANLNHLSRTYLAEKKYAEAINYSQRALILSRQGGDSLGEANALANLGYSEVFQAQQLEQMEPEVYESAINYLEQGLQLSEKLGDRQSQALCLSSLGIAKVVLGDPLSAIAYLERGWQAAQFSGDLYLQGLNLAYMAEAYHHLQNPEKTIGTAALAMYLLEQIGAKEWQQSAGLLGILQGQLGTETWQKLLAQSRPQIIAVIGVDGYDHLPKLLEKYQRSL